MGVNCGWKRGGLGVDAPATAVAVASWTARTGIYGGEGTEVSDNSEWIGLDAPDAPQVIADLYPTYLTLPDGLESDTVAGIVGRIWGGFEGDSSGAATSTVPATVIQNSYEAVARCAWHRDWLNAEDQSDASGVSDAAAALLDAATWQATVTTDGGGIVSSLKKTAEQAKNGNRAAVLDGYEVEACNSLTGVLDPE